MSVQDPDQPPVELPQTIPIPDADESDSDVEDSVDSKMKDNHATQKSKFLKGMPSVLISLTSSLTIVTIRAACFDTRVISLCTAPRT